MRRAILRLKSRQRLPANHDTLVADALVAPHPAGFFGLRTRETPVRLVEGAPE